MRPPFPMIVRRQRLGWWLFLSAGLLACESGTETGNPSFKREFSYAGYSSSVDLGVGEGPSVASVVVVRAWLSLDDVTLTRSDACNPSELSTLDLPALGVGDHAAGSHNYTEFAASAGRVCGATLPFAMVTSVDDASSAPPALVGHSVLLDGRLADGTLFRILSSSAPAIAFDLGESALELSDDEADLLVVFDFASWLSGLDFSAAQRVDGSIEVSESSNTELLATFESNLRRGVMLYRDRDGDGRIDEGSEPLAFGE